MCELAHLSMQIRHTLMHKMNYIKSTRLQKKKKNSARHLTKKFKYLSLCFLHFF